MEGPTEAELRAFFGPRADYYLAQWRGTARRPYNLAAALFSGFWLPFRRLYRHAAVFWAVALGLVVSAKLLPALPKPVEPLIQVAMFSTCAAFGNGWYLARAREMVAR